MENKRQFNYTKSLEISEKLIRKIRLAIIKEEPSDEAFHGAMFALSRSLVHLALGKHLGNRERAITEISDCINCGIQTEADLIQDMISNNEIEKEWEKFSKYE
jgi:hypothetical protein